MRMFLNIMYLQILCYLISEMYTFSVRWMPDNGAGSGMILVV